MKNYKFTINGNKYSVDVADIEDNKAQIELNGTPYTVELDMPNLNVPRPVATPKVVKITAPPAPKAAAATASVPPAQTAPSGSLAVKSPLPGTVLDIFVRQGDKVKSGQHIILLEAMKMENNIDAPKDGTISSIRVQRNDSVMEGDLLLTIE